MCCRLRFTIPISGDGDLCRCEETHSTFIILEAEEDRKRQERWMLFALFSVALSEVRRRVAKNSEPSHKHNLWTVSSLTTHQTNFKLQLLQLHHIHSFAREHAEVLSFFKICPDKPPLQRNESERKVTVRMPFIHLCMTKKLGPPQQKYTVRWRC